LAELGLQIATSLDRFWHYRTYQSEGCRWLERGLTAEAHPIPPLLRARALTLAAYLHSFQGESDRARHYYTESAAIFRAHDDRAGLAATLDGLADIAYVNQHHERARQLQKENLALRQAIGDRWGAMMAMMGLGLIDLGEGKTTEAQRFLEESLTQSRALGDLRGTATQLLILGWIAMAETDTDRTIALFEESLTLLHQARNGVGIAECLEGLACAAGLRGDPLLAAQLAGAASALRERMLVSISFNIYLYERHLNAARTAASPAEWAAAYETGRNLELEQAIATALTLA
jgi:non-specific serine/threonine protein kinase